MNESSLRYRYLWGFYVRGFKPWKHCQPCFVGERAEGIFPDMKDGTIELPKRADYFYLHGFARGPKALRGPSNLHLAVRRKEGARAYKKSAYGPEFTIFGAEEVFIQEPIPGLPGVDPTTEDYKDWVRCKNFRFAAQVFQSDILGPTAPNLSVKAVRTA